MKRMMSTIAAAATALAVAVMPLAAAEMGDDGLHKATWMRDTFKDLRED
ncbi:MAG TPA: thioredoxin, partial [Paracoccaceae bacterium]|nr:thioredoxin [Paracoccaceae bacterium]